MTTYCSYNALFMKGGLSPVIESSPSEIWDFVKKWMQSVWFCWKSKTEQNQNSFIMQCLCWLKLQSPLWYCLLFVFQGRKKNGGVKGKAKRPPPQTILNSFILRRSGNIEGWGKREREDENALALCWRLKCFSFFFSLKLEKSEAAGIGTESLEARGGSAGQRGNAPFSAELQWWICTCAWSSPMSPCC